MAGGSCLNVIGPCRFMSFRTILRHLPTVVLHYFRHFPSFVSGVDYRHLGPNPLILAFVIHCRRVVVSFLFFRFSVSCLFRFPFGIVQYDDIYSGEFVRWA